MKLSKSFFQICSAIFFTSTLVLGFSMTSWNNMPNFPVDDASERITWADAQTYHTEYMNFKPMRVEYPEGASGATRTDLAGFVFNASQLNEIINSNASGTTPDSVYFMFGKHGHFNEGLLGMHRRANMRIIAIGMNGHTLLTGGLNPSIFDKASPCPPYCPQ